MFLVWVPRSWSQGAEDLGVQGRLGSAEADEASLTRLISEVD